MHVSFYNYRRMNDFLRQDIRRELERLFSVDSDQTFFKYMYSEERKIGKVLGGGFSIGTASGTAALQFSLISLGIGPGDEVITASNTYVSTLHAITATGAVPKLIDANEDTMLMDLGQIEHVITEKTKAIIPVHFHGQMINMKVIEKIAKKHGLSIIEDACQAQLARYAGELPGKRSDAVAYSFSPNKRFGGFGDGGMVKTRRWSVFRNVEHLRNPTYHTPLVLRSNRTPSYLNPMEIALISAKLKYLKEWTETCRTIAQWYYEGLSSTPLILPGVDPKAHHTFLFFTVRDKKRNRLYHYLRRKGIESIVWYPNPIHLHHPYKYLGYHEGSFPISEKICETRLCLPINPFLTDGEVDYVIKTVKKFYRRLLF